jgi:hypothetical protein
MLYVGAYSVARVEHRRSTIKPGWQGAAEMGRHALAFDLANEAAIARARLAGLAM